MTSNYEKIRNENIEEYGKGTRHLSFLGRLYTDRTHFIFELLQNAEDAGATRILFMLFDDRLEVSHDGRLFNERDVKGVCGVGEGTKADDLTQIGKFGIGFKSVYAYTIDPEIHSGDEHFRIEHYIRPYPVEPQKPGSPYTTLFIFTFNRDEVNAETACHEIGLRLLNLDSKTLLFLCKIDEIEYKLPDQTGGIYMRETKPRGIARQVTVIGQNNGKEDNQEWLIFERPVQVPNKSVDVKVEIAFQVESNSKNSTEAIKKISSSPLVVYFPTEKETRFGFLIQGPYRTTPARDNIPQNDDWNKTLIAETAQLLSDTLLELKSLGLLTVAALQALPIRMSDFPQDGMFYLIVDSVRKTLASKDLLPTDGGAFTSAQTAKLASGADLRALLKSEQLSLLFQSKDALNWLVGEITQDRTPDLHEYIFKELHVDELTPDSFARKITEAFLTEQSDNWIVKFYEYLSGHKALWRPSRWYGDEEGILRAKPILRLQSGEHVKPFKDNGDANAYLTKSKENTNLPIIKIEIVQQEAAFQFLQKHLEIPELDIVEDVIANVIPKYLISMVSPSSLEEHICDMKLIKRAYETDSREKKERLRKALAETRFILVQNPEADKTFFQKPSNVYFLNENLRIYFSENSEIGFASPEYDDEILAVLKEIGVKESVRVNKKQPNYAGDIVIRNWHGDHARGLDGFDPDIEVDGLKHALRSPTISKSIFIWNYVAIPNMSCIQGKIESSRRQDFSYSSIRETQSHEFGRLLVETRWLPDVNGIMHRPNEITLAELPAEFVRNESLAHILLRKEALPEQKNNVQEEALNVLAKGDSEKKEILGELAALSIDDLKEIRKAIPHETLPEPAPTFKDGLKNLERSQSGAITSESKGEKSPVSDVDRYQKGLNDLVESGVEEHKSTPRRNRFSPAKNTPSNADARSFLYEEYQGHCQVTGVTFPKAAKNSDGMAENYFEACSLLSYGDADYLNDAGNMVCVSADTMAKFKHASLEFLDDIEDVIRTFKESGGNMESMSVKIRLAGEDCSIMWSQRHFMRLVALYEKA